LLETAGGIGNVADLLGDEPFVVYNGDILTDLPLGRLIERHRSSGNEVTLALRSSGGPLHIGLDEASGRVTDIRNLLGVGAAAAQFLFAGVYVVSPEFLARIPRGEKVSVVPLFLEMIRVGARLGGVVLDEGRWWDLGTREEYLKVHRHLAEDAGDFWPDGESPVWVHPTARVASSAAVSGATAIGPGAEVGEGARLTDCVLWEGARVEAESVLDNCIVTADRTACHVHSGRDF
jgi:NDP-sugar pyrophosphorylase family protein